MKRFETEVWIKKKIIGIFLYVILFTASFSDIFRITGTSITIFRMLIPIAVIILALYPYWAIRFGMTMLGLSLLTAIQYIIFYKVIHPELRFINTRIVFYLFICFCALLIFYIVKIIQINNDEQFEKKFSCFIIIVGVGLLSISFLYNIKPSFFGGLLVDNRNNYACYIAALIPFLLVKFQTEKKIRAILGMIAGLILLIINDSKAALFGVVIEFIIFGCIAFEIKTRKQMLFYRGVIIIVGIVGIALLLIINPSLNGYTLRGLIAEPIQRVLTNSPYPYYTTSITYRTNTTIYAIWTFLLTAGIGLGIGNTGVALKAEFPNLNPEYTQALNAQGLSLHNSWLEIMLDVGIIVLIVYVIIIIYAIKLYIKKKNFTQLEKIRVLYIFSFPVWIISTSGINTLYYLMIVMAFLLFANNHNTLFQSESVKK